MSSIEVKEGGLKVRAEEEIGLTGGLERVEVTRNSALPRSGRPTAV